MLYKKSSIKKTFSRFTANELKSIGNMFGENVVVILLHVLLFTGH